MIMQLLNLILSILNQILSILKSIFSKFGYPGSKIIHFDNGISVKIGNQIAEGGFSYIYSAVDADSRSISSRQFALKRIICPDDDIVLACRKEARVHRTLGGSHSPNTLPLLGLKFDVSSPQTVCYMLFPLLTGGSLRDEISKRMLLKDDMMERDRHPFSEREVLNIFRGILRGVEAMHNVGLAHCDVKVENVLLDLDNSCDEELGGTRASEVGGIGTPVLMDFGSARSLVVRLTDRRTVLTVTEEAEQNSTVSYRAPELFEGGCRHGPHEADIDGKIDVWSCGCVLYALMYGTSPFEMEFRQDGSVRIVECTYLRILGGKVPSPPKNTDVGKRYSQEMTELVQWILNVDRVQRPTLIEVTRRVEDILLQKSSSRDAFDGFEIKQR